MCNLLNTVLQLIEIVRSICAINSKIELICLLATESHKDVQYTKYRVYCTKVNWDKTVKTKLACKSTMTLHNTVSCMLTAMNDFYIHAFTKFLF